MSSFILVRFKLVHPSPQYFFFLNRLSQDPMGCREKMPGARLVDLCGIRHRVLDIDVCGIRYALLARSRRLWVCFVDVSSVLMHQEVIRDKSSGPECSYHSIDAYEFSKKKKPCKRNASVLDFLAVVCVEVQWLLLLD